MVEATLEEFDKLTEQHVEEIVRFIHSAKAEEQKKSASELVPQKYHRYLKVFEEKASERMPVRKLWDHAIDLKEGFELKKTEKGKSISAISRGTTGSHSICQRSIGKRLHQTIKVTTDVSSLLHSKERWQEADSPGLPLSQQLDC